MMPMQKRLFYILTFCYNKTSHKFSQKPPTHQKRQIAFWSDNMNMGGSL